MKRHNRQSQEARKARQKKIALLSVILAMVVVVGLGIGITVAIATPNTVSMPTIQRVTCLTTTEQSCPDQWQTAATTIIGQPLLFSDVERDLMTPLMNVGAELDDYQRILPDTLQLSVKPTSISLYLTKAQETYGVLQDGSLVKTDAVGEGVATVDVSTLDFPDGKAPKWLQESVSLLQSTASEEGWKVENVRAISAVEMRFRPKNGTLDFIINPQEYPLEIQKAAYIMKTKEIDSPASMSAELDLRLRLPVLRRNP